MSMPLSDLDLRVTLTDHLDDLVAAYEVAGRSPRTISLFSTHIKALAEFVGVDGVTTLDEVTTAAITKYLAMHKRRGLQPASLHLILRTIRRYFQYAIEQGHLTTNPAKGVLPPKVIVEPVKFMSDAEIARLLDVIKADKSVEGVRDGAFIRVLIDTGIRRGELIGLRVDDVSQDLRDITVRAVTSKTHSGRTLPLSKDTTTHLRQYMRVRAAYLAKMRRHDTGELWIASKGSLSGNGALQALWRRCEAAGLPRVSLHQFRHRMAARAIEAGLPMPYLVRIGGWANAEMPSNRYGQWQVAERASEAMRAYLDK